MLSCLLSLRLTPNKERKKFDNSSDTIPLFRGIAILQILGPAQLAFSSYGQYQAAMRVNLKDKWFPPIIELGIEKLTQRILRQN